MRKPHPIIVLILISLFPLRGSAEDRYAAPSVAELISAADRAVEWRPDWPAALPPDAFVLRSGRRARSVSLTADDDAEYAVRWDEAGRPLERPFFSAGAAYRLGLSRDEAGRLTGCSWDADAVALSYGEDGSVAAAVREREGQSVVYRYYSAGEVLEEISYDEEGRASSRVSLAFSRDGLRSIASYSESGEASAAAVFDYDSGGRTTRVVYGDASFEAVYGDDGFPRTALAVPGAERRFQWDERGLLVRETRYGPDANEEIVYVYVFDAAGEWIARHALRYVERFGIRAPEAGRTVRRRIDYY